MSILDWISVQTNTHVITTKISSEREQGIADLQSIARFFSGHINANFFNSVRTVIS